MVRQWLPREGWARMFASVKPTELWQDFDQAMLRVTVPSLVLLGFVVHWVGGVLGFWAVELSENEVHALWFMIIYFLFAVSLALWILAHPHVSVARRYIAIFADIGGNTYLMIAAGELGAAVFAVYLFLTFGNGFRYGRTYLHVSQALSLLGFGFVCYYSDFWSHHGWVVVGIVVAMVSLPFYVAHLKSNLEKAKKRAEEANKALERTARDAQQQVRELSRKLAELTPPIA